MRHLMMFIPRKRTALTLLISLSLGAGVLIYTQRTFAVDQEIQKLNEMADKTRMAGQYSPSGLRLAEVNAQKNAEDLMRARSMIGIGGTLVPGAYGQRGY